MNQIDIAVTQYVNSFARHSMWFDHFVLEVLQLNTVKMMPMVMLMVWLWFSAEDEPTQAIRRKSVFDGFAGGFFALVITRIVQNLSPHRPRPALNGTFDFVIPAGGYTNDWSSFPSDTAGLAFALAFAVWLASRRLGLLAFFWAIFVISFPRLYGGFHYLSDLVAGALIGILCTYTCYRAQWASVPLFNACMRLATSHRALFYALAFIMAFQTSTYFGDVRKAGEKALHVIGAK